MAKSSQALLFHNKRGALSTQNREVNEALTLFYQQVKGGKEFLKSSKGVLLIPNLVKARVGVGGQYGEAALRIGGKTVDYYSIAAGSAGLQIGL